MPRPAAQVACEHGAALACERRAVALPVGLVVGERGEAPAEALRGAGEERAQRLERHRLGQPDAAVDEAQRAPAPWLRGHGRAGGVGAQRVSGEHGRLEPERVRYRRCVGRVRGEPERPVAGRAAAPAQVERDDVVVAGQERREVQEVQVVRRDAVQQDDRPPGAGPLAVGDAAGDALEGRAGQAGAQVSSSHAHPPATASPVVHATVGATRASGNPCSLASASVLIPVAMPACSTNARGT